MAVLPKTAPVVPRRHVAWSLGDVVENLLTPVSTMYVGEHCTNI